jgi:two-component system invasion response regulator UvrY
MLKLLLVDDHPLVRDSLIRVLEDSFPSLRIDEAASGQEAISKIWKSDYDAVLLDISMPGRDGLNTLTQLRGLKPDLPILVLSILSEELYGPRVLKSGASGFLSKTHPAEELIRAVKKILEGKKYISQSLAEKIALNYGNEKKDTLHEQLSDREFQVLRMIALGKSIGAIGNEMFLSKEAIFKIRAGIKRKLQKKNTLQIIRYAIEEGFVE